VKRISMSHVKCSNCGHCCQNVAITQSPATLKEWYLNWRDNKKHPDGAKKKFANDIWLLFPMLMYKGFDKKVKRHRYFCKNLKKIKGKNEYTCTIYPIRPEMCAEFGRDAIKHGYLMDKSNKKLYPKCSLC